MTSLNFRKAVKDAQSLSINEYIGSLLKVFTANATASQLEHLYRPLKGELNEVQSILKQEIVRQIKQCTTITKMFYSVYLWVKRKSMINLPISKSH